jgi:hypothetical protein
MAQQIADGISKEVCLLLEAIAAPAHSQITKAGTGPRPQKGQTITVHCTGKLDNGKKFWRCVRCLPFISTLLPIFNTARSTKDPGQSTFSFPVGLGKVIQGQLPPACGLFAFTLHSKFVSDYFSPPPRKKSRHLTLTREQDGMWAA